MDFAIVLDEVLKVTAEAADFIRSQAGKKNPAEFAHAADGQVLGSPPCGYFRRLPRHLLPS